MREKWRAYRVIAVTDELNRDSLNHTHHQQFEPSLSAPSYCTPGIMFWLSEKGIEDPDAECILVEFPLVKHAHSMPGMNYRGPFADNNTWSVEFEWDGGRYLGTLKWPADLVHLHWANKQICDAMISDISSL